MIVVVADTSGLLAALDATHPLGEPAREVVDRAALLVVSPVLLREVDHVGRRVLGRHATYEAIDDVVRWARAGRAVLPTITAEVLARAQALREHYAADLDLDLPDAVNVVLAAQFHTDAVLTLDVRDFRAVRPLTEHAAIRALPQDL